MAMATVSDATPRTTAKRSVDDALSGDEMATPAVRPRLSPGKTTAPLCRRRVDVSPSRLLNICAKVLPIEQVAVVVPATPAVVEAIEPPQTPTKAQVQVRLEKAQDDARRAGKDALLKWLYDSSDELTGATCAGVSFTRAELLLLTCF